MWKEFKEFAIKGNAMDLAIGVIIGAAFGGIVTSLVNDIIMPGISVLLGKVNFSNMFWTLSGSHESTLAAAKAAGSVTLNYGQFLNTVLNFVIVAFSIFLVVKQLNRFRKPAVAGPTPLTKDQELLVEIRDALKK